MTAVASKDWVEHADRVLSGAGYRSGGARRSVVEFLAGQECCMTAREIADALRGQGQEVGMASVYRALDVLSGLGLVQRLEVGEGSARYEPALPSGEHHHHLVCDRCGGVTAFEDAALERAIERLSDKVGFSVERHDVVLHGECTGCAARG